MIILIILIFLLIFFNSFFINEKISFCQNSHLKSIQSVVEYESNDFFKKIFNPSIVFNNNELIIVARKSSNTLKSIFHWSVNRILKTNFSSIVFFKYNFEKQKLSFIKEFTTKENNLEDPRIIFYKNNYYVSITEFHSEKHIFPIIYKFDQKFNFIKKIKYCFSEKRNKIEKNWCLFIHQNELYLHTDCFPNWKIYKININELINTADCLLILNLQNIFSLNFKQFLRCSTSWKDFDSNFYIVGLHTKIFNLVTVDIKSKFVLVNKSNLIPQFISKEICFSEDFISHARIQFLSGIETNDKYLFLSFGIGDFKFLVKKIKKKNLLNFFQKIQYKINE